MKSFLFWILVILFSYFEAYFLLVPVALAILITNTFATKKASNLLLAASAGLVFDIFSMRLLGGTSLFYVSSCFLVLIYAEKLETGNPAFVVIFTFAGSSIFMFLLGVQNFIPPALFSSLVSGLIFFASGVKYRRTRISI